MLYSYDGSAYSAFSVTYNTGVIKNCPSNVQVFDSDGLVTDTIAAGEWYTIVVKVNVASGSNWSSIQFQSKWTNIAIDNIEYYYNGVPALWTE